MNPTLTSRAYYPALDVLRGIAIIFVCFYHNFQFLQVFNFGWTGVDLFFVLSGFLITDILMSSFNGKHFFRNFYIRRFLRIFPLYYGTLILFLIISPYFFSKHNINVYNYYNDNQFWFWTHLQNWLFVKKGLNSSPFLTHFWSLAVEEQFYLFWPLIVYFLKENKKIKTFIIVLIFLALSLRIYTWAISPADFVKYYCNTLTRMDSILVGCFLSIFIKEGHILSNKRLKLILSTCLFYILVGFFFGKTMNITNPYFSTFGYTVFSILFATLLYIFIKKDFQVFRYMKKSILLNYIGKISYGIYVFHIPIYLVISSILMNILHSHLKMNTLQALLSIATISLLLTLLASSLSFYLFERPILNLKRYFQYN